MRILYVAAQYDYGKPEQGYSFEHYNFFDCLLKMGHDILYFDFPTLYQQRGQEAMNRRLLEVAQAEKPQLMFTLLFQNEFFPETIRTISEGGQTPTFNWFTDDHWRFDNYSSQWAPWFNWVSTTASSALPKYAAIGCRNVVKTQWACNPYLYRRLENVQPRYDVTFVGQPHGMRRQIIEALRRAGISVNVWGSGWENGRLTQDEMIQVFNQSKINLNLSNSSVSSANPQSTRLRRLLNSTSAGRRLKNAAKSLLFRSKTTATAITQSHDQIKGRNFEVPGCGAFLLSGYADNLEAYYTLDQELVCFFTLDELIDKTRYYLAHEQERQQIADAGYKRTLREHTYVHRFAEIFQRMGFDEPAPEHILNRVIVQAGQVEIVS